MKSFVSAFRMAAYLLSAIGIVSVANISAAEKKPDAKTKKISFDEHIEPLFRAKCFGCHNASKKAGDLNLTSYLTMMVGGGSGEVIEPGDLDGSFLWSLVTHEEDPHMPPKSDKLPKASLDLIKAWIEGGALENSGSKFVNKKPKFDFTLKGIPTGKPEVAPMPLRLGLEPVVKTVRNGASTALATNPWSPLAAVAGQRQVLLYNTQTLQLVGVLPYPEGIPHVLKFSRNGSLLMAGGGRGAYKGRVVVFDVKTGKRVFQVGDELDTVLGADISADQSLIALGSSGKVVRVYSTSDGELVYEIKKKHNQWIYCVEFSPDGVLLATADRSGGMFIWEAETGRQYLTLRGHSGAINSLSWRSDSNILASCGADARIRLWEMENGRQVKNWSAHGGGAQSVEFCRDGNLVSCGRDRVTKLWNQGGSQIRAFAALGEYALNVTYCDETKRVIAGDLAGSVKIWNAADGKEFGELSSNPPLLAERLATATTISATKQAEQKKLATTYQTAQAVVTKITTDLNTANKAVADLTKRTQTYAATLKQVMTNITQTTAQQQSAEKSVATLGPVVPLLKATYDQGVKTAAKAAGDKEIAAAVAQLNAVLDKRTVELATFTKSVFDKKAAIVVAKKQLVDIDKQMKATATAMTVAKKQVTDLTAAAKPAQVKSAAAKTAADAATQAAAASQKEVDRWKAEIEFAAKMNVLAQRESEYEQLAAIAAQEQAVVDKTKAELVSANQTVSATQKQVEATSSASKQAKVAVDQATTLHQTATNAALGLGQALPLLREAVAKGQAAAKTAGNDKELMALAAQLKVIADKKVIELAAIKKTVVEKNTAVEKSKQLLATATTQAQQASKALVAAQKQAADKATTIKSLEAKSAAAKNNAAAAAQRLATTRKEIDALTAQST